MANNIKVHSSKLSTRKDLTMTLPDVEEFQSTDSDVCTKDEISKLFCNRYIEVKKKKIKADMECSSLLASNHSDYVAIVSSEKLVTIINKETLTEISSYKPHKKDITDISFSPQAANNLYTSSLDGRIQVYDLRSNLCEKSINMNTDKSKKPLTCFDIASHEKVLCAGTELIGEDSFLLFWDLRGDELLGGYWESHSDDISKIKFSPNQDNVLASTGLDGLLNVFDVSQQAEEDALTYCLNTEDVVNVLNWYTTTDTKNQNVLALTDVRSIQKWNIEESAPTFKFSRESITKSLRRTITYECYPVNTYYSSLRNKTIILAGSGLEHDNNCLRTLQLNEKSGELEPHGIFVSQNDKLSSIIQCSYYDETQDSFLTVSEDGFLSWWKNRTKETDQSAKIKSTRSNLNKKKLNPY